MEPYTEKEKLRLLLIETSRAEALVPFVVSKQMEGGFSLIPVQDSLEEDFWFIGKNFSSKKDSRGYHEKEEKELFDFAFQNTMKNYPPVFGTMFEMTEYLVKGVKIPNSNPMKEEFLKSSYSSENYYALTNEQGCCGAAVAYYPDVLKNIGKVLKDDFFMIPSSVHEFLIVPEKLFLGKERELQEMILQGNREVIDEKIFLSDNLRKYLRKEDKIIIVN